MSLSDRSLDVVAFVSDHFRDILRRRMRELFGLLLLGCGLVGAIALATWSVQDPSLSHAANGKIHNLLGHSGAVIADLAMQLVGLASIVLLMPFVAVGWRLLAHKPLVSRWRNLFWLPAAFGAAAFFACLPRTAGWPLPSGLGGVIGDGIVQVPLSMFGMRAAGLNMLGAGLLTLIATAMFLTLALDLRLPERKETVAVEETDESDDEENDDDVSRWNPLGWLTHEFLSIKARISRLFRRAPRTAKPAPTRRVAGSRVEPRLDAPALGDVPDAQDFEDGYEDEEEEPQAPRRKRAAAKPAPRRSGSSYVLPPLNVLAAQKASERTNISQATIQENATSLEGVLGEFGVRGQIINARPGPVVTLYELEPAPGIKSSRVIGLADDIARSMSAVSARVAVVAGRNAIGIELPNAIREKVYFRDILQSDDYANTSCKLPLCLGKTIGGESVVVDLARMPHLLIAGTTGSGKSVAINTMLLSLLYKLRPDQCRLIMVDPKMLELSVYEGIPHLLTPVVTDPKKAVVALKWAVREMEERYKKMSKLGVRNIDGYNMRIAEAKAKGEKLTRTVHTGYDKDSGEAIYENEELDLNDLPYIVVVVDEMADLMMVAGKDIEGTIQRLAQMARAAGIHVVLATQRPSVDVITGTIKANFPTRISFQVTSKIDSRTILGEQGAEQLLGQGDMLYMAGGGRISRVHGPFVSDDEVEKVVRHLKSQGTPQYLEEVTAATEEEGEDGAVFDNTGMGTDGAGDLYEQAVAIVRRDRKASTSYIQRRLQIGYNRAASIMERMEAEGVVGQANHAGKREILIGEGEHERY
ncbi:DNA translocase FtsK [Pseudolabrys sp.]|uniref:DNA translocase FtsK n=1 Tax=Pseudolabrys sp. TaxID=1960880 RepID=UPI003D14AE1B